MGTVTKTAAQLLPGDIFDFHGERAVVLHMIDRGPEGAHLYSAVLKRQPQPVAEPPLFVSWDSHFDVEVPARPVVIDPHAAVRAGGLSAPILRALLLVLQASHRAFANADKSVIHEGWCTRPEDHAALNVALVRLSSRLPSTTSDVSLTLRTEIALESLLASLEFGSQVHPDSALPSRPDYHAGFDTTSAQYGALASMRAPVRGGNGS